LHFPILRTPAIPLLSYGIILAVACFSCLYAQPYKGHLNDLSWGKYAAPSPMELLEESSHDYETQPTDMDPSEGIIEENPPTNHKNDNLPNNYEELDSMFGNDNNLQPSKIPQRAPQESGHEYLDPSPSEILPKESDPGTQGKLNPASMTSKQLAGFLSQFYLIRTPYGYILGRHNPTSSTTSISRRSMQPPKPRLKDHYGSIMNPLHGAFVPPFGIRKPIAKSNSKKKYSKVIRKPFQRETKNRRKDQKTFVHFL